MENNRIEIIAEIANAHQGSAETAHSLAMTALKSGADAVKFQIYSADELLVKSHPRYEHFLKQSFPPGTWAGIISSIIAEGGKVYCDVFGLDALSIATACKVSGYKVHSSDLGNIPLLNALVQVKGRIMLAVGGSTIREIGHAVKILSRPTTEGIRPVLLHGFQNYPTAVEDSKLLRINRLREIFSHCCDFGYMDHTDGDDDFALILPLLTIGSGISVLEKHITLDRAARGVDYYSSMNPDEFAQFVKMVRQTEQAFGSLPEDFAESERIYRKQVKKHWVTASPLNPGHVLSVKDLVMKRVSDHDADTVELDKLVGKSLVIACNEEHPITRAEVRQTVWAMVVARMRSTRLPGKALLDAAGMPALRHLLERLKQSCWINQIVLCTTIESEDDILADLAAQVAVSCHRGSVEDVLGRILGALNKQNVDVILRVTGDDILVDPDYVDRAIQHHLQVNAEYSDLKALPSGTEVEVFDVKLCQDLWKAAKDSSGTEYLTSYITAHRDQFRTASVPVDDRHSLSWRLTLDTAEDYQVILTLLENMKAIGKGLSYRMDDIVDFFTAHPDVLEINSRVRQRQTPIEVCTELDWSQVV